MANQGVKKGRRVGVIMGGPSSEREISLRSGQGVLSALLLQGHDAVGIDWRAGESLPAALAAASVEVAWVALHGVWGEDGCVQGLLECLGIPYTGSGVMGSAIAMDKVMSKHIFDRVGVPTAAWRVVSPEVLAAIAAGGDEGLAATATLLRAVPLPVVIKPSREGSSVGVTIVHDEGALAAALAEAHRHHGEVLIEEYVRGREINVGILGDEVLGDVEVRPNAAFYSYEAKYQRSDTEYLCPAPVSGEEHARLGEIARLAHQALGCSTYSRVDLILGESGRVICLEVNTLPGMTDKSLLPKIAAARGVAYEVLVERILLGASLKA